MCGPSHEALPWFKNRRPVSWIPRADVRLSPPSGRSAATRASTGRNAASWPSGLMSMPSSHTHSPSYHSLRGPAGPGQSGAGADRPRAGSRTRRAGLRPRQRRTLAERPAPGLPPPAPPRRDYASVSAAAVRPRQPAPPAAPAGSAGYGSARATGRRRSPPVLPQAAHYDRVGPGRPGAGAVGAAVRALPGMGILGGAPPVQLDQPVRLGERSRRHEAVVIRVRPGDPGRLTARQRLLTSAAWGTAVGGPISRRDPSVYILAASDVVGGLDAARVVVTHPVASPALAHQRGDDIHVVISLPHGDSAQARISRASRMLACQTNFVRRP